MLTKIITAAALVIALTAPALAQGDFRVTRQSARSSAPRVIPSTPTVGQPTLTTNPRTDTGGNFGNSYNSTYSTTYGNGYGATYGDPRNANK